MRSLVLALLLLLIAPSAYAQTARERLERLAADYGIEIEVLDKEARFDRAGYVVSGKLVPEEMLERYVLRMETEWRRYPVSLMARVHLKRIVIGSDVRVQDQPRAAVPEFEPGWFWLDADIGSRRPSYGAHVIHHDFFHMIDEWDTPDGRLDPEWKALDGAGRPDGPGGWAMQKGNPGALRVDIPGFITLYATSAVEEDKAEVFSHLLTSTAFLFGRAALDPVLSAKVARIKALLAAFEPAMGSEWWPSFPRPTLK